MGAQGMALEGRKAEEIVKYFYTGIELGEAANFSIGNNLQKNSSLAYKTRNRGNNG